MKWFVYPLVLLLVACANLPPAIEDAPAVDISYPQAAQAIGSYRAAAVRWGGTLVEVENEQTGSQLQVLSYPLNNYGRPRLDKPSQGRFIIKSPDFLDPAVYAKNSEITVAGALNGDEERTVGKKVLRLPVVSASVIHLWPVEQRNDCSGVGGGFGYGYSPFGYNPYWGGYYRPLPYRR
jgi:outer membrane lipoprotein